MKQINESIFDDIISALGLKKTDDPKKADIISSDVQDFFSTLENAVSKGGLEQQPKRDMTYQKEVEALQIGLILLGYNLPIYGVDGLYGSETAKAVNKFITDDVVKTKQGEKTPKISKATPLVIKKLINKLKNKGVTKEDLEKYIDQPFSGSEKYKGIRVSKKGRELLNDPVFSKKLDQVCNNLGIQKEWLIKVMSMESGVDPYIENQIGCVGLIQFCPSTPRGNYKKIGNKVVDLQELKTMSPLYQLELIEDFYKPYKRMINSYDDLYMATFYPEALGKPDSYVIGGSGKYGLKVSAQNPAIARAAGKIPGKEPLTVGDFKIYT